MDPLLFARLLCDGGQLLRIHEVTALFPMPAQTVGRVVMALTIVLAGLGAGAQNRAAQQPAPTAQELLDELPAVIRDQREIERLERERRKEEIRNDVEALQGLQTEELETKHSQLEKLKEMLELHETVRDLVLASPELEPIYQQVINVAVGSPSCGCLGRIELNSVGAGRRAGMAVLSLDDSPAEYRQGDSIGTTSCEVGTVGAAEVTVRCGTRSCVHTVGRITRECD